MASIDKNGLVKASESRGARIISISAFMVPGWHFILFPIHGVGESLPWQNGEASHLSDGSEFGLPQWNFGTSTYCFAPDVDDPVYYLQE